MRKIVISIGILIMSLALFSACGYKMTTHEYENEAILGIEIEKTEAYLDKLVITFAEDSVSDIEKVEIEYYDSTSSLVEETPEFSFNNDVLTIETNYADVISEMRIWEKDRDVYFHIRYIYSESYAMLVYSWTDDVGYMVNGDKDAYYTQEEKDEQNELAEIQAEAEAFAFSSIQGEWMNENETVRILIDYNEEYERYFSVCKLENSEWIEYDSMFIGEISPHGDDAMALYDNSSFGRRVIVELEDDNTMKFDHSEELHYRKSDVN